jgi:hypothetical protein
MRFANIAQGILIAGLGRHVSPINKEYLEGTRSLSCRVFNGLSILEDRKSPS